ncbi:MAG TPA: hypothetical protein VI953_01140 [Candidatus Paceibacterota bacterium]
MFEGAPQEMEMESEVMNREQTPGQELAKLFKEAGVKTRVVTIGGGGEFEEAVILEKTEIPESRMIRLYRGVSHLDASLLEQVPYALRGETDEKTKKPEVLEAVRPEVEALANNPTYANLIAYVDKVRPYLSEWAQSKLDEDLERFEDDVLSGESTRRTLVYKQLGHNGGYADRDLTPYISASTDLSEAVGYGQKGVLIIDMPIGEIEDHFENEVHIKGVLDRKYITAVLPRKLGISRSNEEATKEARRVVGKVDENSNAYLHDSEALVHLRDGKRALLEEVDKVQWRSDVELLRERRVAKLVTTFPEAKVDIVVARQEAGQQGVDVYTIVKQNIFDMYAKRATAIGRNGINLENQVYKESEYGQDLKFDRNKVSDKTLIKLKERIERLETLERERQARRKEWDQP